MTQTVPISYFTVLLLHFCCNRYCHCHCFFGCAVYKALISLVLCGGALPLVVAFLDRRAEARTAFQILQCVCSMDPDLTYHHADLLARLQGVCRLSNIFCTVQTSMAPSKAAGISLMLFLCHCMLMPCTFKPSD